MGFFADLKAKRADKKALRAFEAESAIWQEDAATLEKLIEVFNFEKWEKLKEQSRLKS